jgi:hypothetical protein
LEALSPEGKDHVPHKTGLAGDTNGGNSGHAPTLAESKPSVDGTELLFLCRQFAVTLRQAPESDGTPRFRTESPISGKSPTMIAKIACRLGFLRYSI